MSATVEQPLAFQQSPMDAQSFDKRSSEVGMPPLPSPEPGAPRRMSWKSNKKRTSFAAQELQVLHYSELPRVSDDDASNPQEASAVGPMRQHAVSAPEPPTPSLSDDPDVWSTSSVPIAPINKKVTPSKNRADRRERLKNKPMTYGKPLGARARVMSGDTTKTDEEGQSPSFDEPSFNNSALMYPALGSDAEYQNAATMEANSGRAAPSPQNDFGNPDNYAAPSRPARGRGLPSRACSTPASGPARGRGLPSRAGTANLATPPPNSHPQRAQTYAGPRGRGRGKGGGKGEVPRPATMGSHPPGPVGMGGMMEGRPPKGAQSCPPAPQYYGPPPHGAQSCPPPPEYSARHQAPISAPPMSAMMQGAAYHDELARHAGGPPNWQPPPGPNGHMAHEQYAPHSEPPWYNEGHKWKDSKKQGKKELLGKKGSKKSKSGRFGWFKKKAKKKDKEPKEVKPKGPKEWNEERRKLRKQLRKMAKKAKWCNKVCPREAKIACAVIFILPVFFFIGVMLWSLFSMGKSDLEPDLLGTRVWYVRSQEFGLFGSGDKQGKYFYFGEGDLGDRLENRDADEEVEVHVHQYRYDRKIWSGSVVCWRNFEGLSGGVADLMGLEGQIGEMAELVGHGRRKLQAEPGQWMVGDKIVLYTPPALPWDTLKNGEVVDSTDEAAQPTNEARPASAINDTVSTNDTAPSTSPTSGGRLLARHEQRTGGRLLQSVNMEGAEAGKSNADVHADQSASMTGNTSAKRRPGRRLVSRSRDCCEQMACYSCEQMRSEGRSFEEQRMLEDVCCTCLSDVTDQLWHFTLEHSDNVHRDLTEKLREHGIVTNSEYHTVAFEDRNGAAIDLSHGMPLQESFPLTIRKKAPPDPGPFQFTLEYEGGLWRSEMRGYLDWYRHAPEDVYENRVEVTGMDGSVKNLTQTDEVAEDEFPLQLRGTIPATVIEYEWTTFQGKCATSNGNEVTDGIVNSDQASDDDCQAECSEREDCAGYQWTRTRGFQGTCFIHTDFMVNGGTGRRSDPQSYCRVKGTLMEDRPRKLCCKVDPDRFVMEVKREFRPRRGSTEPQKLCVAKAEPILNKCLQGNTDEVSDCKRWEFPNQTFVVQNRLDQYLWTDVRKMIKENAKFLKTNVAAGMTMFTNVEQGDFKMWAAMGDPAVQKKLSAPVMNAIVPAYDKHEERFFPLQLEIQPLDLRFFAEGRMNLPDIYDSGFRIEVRDGVRQEFRVVLRAEVFVDFIMTRPCNGCNTSVTPDVRVDIQIQLPGIHDAIDIKCDNHFSGCGVMDLASEIQGDAMYEGLAMFFSDSVLKTVIAININRALYEAVLKDMVIVPAFWLTGLICFFCGTCDNVDLASFNGRLTTFLSCFLAYFSIVMFIILLCICQRCYICRKRWKMQQLANKLDRDRPKTWRGLIRWQCQNCRDWCKECPRRCVTCTWRDRDEDDEFEYKRRKRRLKRGCCKRCKRMCCGRKKSGQYDTE